MSVGQQSLPDMGWPVICRSGNHYQLECDANQFSWISKHKVFFFKLDTCLEKPRVPLLYSIRCNEHPKRLARYCALNVHVVGPATLAAWTGKAFGEDNVFFAAVTLARVSKIQFEQLLASPPPPPRGRPGVPELRLQDFAPSPFAAAIITHWMQNSHCTEETGGYASEIAQFFPTELIRACKTLSQLNSHHPFSSYVRAPFENGDLRHFRPLCPPENPTFTFIDLFAGIGGFRMALQQEGGRCVFASDIDQAARDLYEKNFRVVPFGDITNPLTKQMIPRDFDVLCGGFPCQAFSLAGKRKGFEDEKRRGTLYREIVEIAREHQPKAIFCENVRGLLSLDGGRACQTILADIESAGYQIVFNHLLNSKDYGVPQNRVRLYIVALRLDLAQKMRQLGLSFPETPPPIRGQRRKTIGDIREIGPVSKTYYPGQSYLETLIRHKRKHKESGESGFGFIVRSDADIAGTLMCGGMGRERNMLLDDNQPDWTSPPQKKGGINKAHYRFMTIREYARLQGFPDAFLLPELHFAGQKLFGNSVTVSAVRAVGHVILDIIQQCEEALP